jgi:dihydropteroate synthase
MQIGNKQFLLGKKTYIMGILNATPDSFSDGGKYNNVDKAIRQVHKMLIEGAHIIDIGGESTRPGHKEISADEEISRVVPIIESLKKEFNNIIISVDTSKSKVAEASINAGADLINDVWGFKKDKEMSHIVSKYNVPCCLMHNKTNTVYNNLIEDVINDLIESIDIALMAGVKKENIIIDPGIGFAKTLNDNLVIMNNLHKLKSLGYPILLGTSRKSMIGLTLDLPTDQRVEGTIATTVIGIMKGCDFIRVHDIKENVRASLMTDAIIR